MRKYQLGLLCLSVLSAAIQAQRVDDHRNAGRPTFDNDGLYTSNNGNRGNSNYDCLNGSRNRLRNSFTDSYMNAACNSRNEWNHGMTRKRTPPILNVDQMEQQLYNDLNSPDPQSIHGAIRRPRKEYRMLSDDERRRFHDALNKLKRHRIGSFSYYDTLSNFHQSYMAPAAHWGPAFLGWHKQYLLRMERALQAIDPTITIPYWDSTLDSHLRGQESNSVMWSADFMGDREGTVRSGPFAGWTLPRPVGSRFNLWRGNNSGLGRMVTDADYRFIINIKDFRRMTWHVDPFVELIHGLVHFWIGGPMSELESSPFDPIFWLHHSFIDLMFDAQRENVRRQGRHPYTYPSIYDDQAFGVGYVQDPLSDVPVILRAAQDSPHYPPTTMLPFKLRNMGSLTEDYKNIYYYAARPTCTTARPDCGSPYLFCIRGTYQCAPKLKIGANCMDFTTSEPCYNGDCVRGICQEKRARDSYNSYDDFFRYLYTYVQTMFN